MRIGSDILTCMSNDIEHFIAKSNKLRILSRIKSVRLSSSIELPCWKSLRNEAEEILNDAGIETVTSEEFLDGQGEAMLLIKWGLPSEDVGIGQLLLFADMQIPGTEDEFHTSVIWLSESLLLLDLQKQEELRKIVLNEIREFAAAHQKACSLPN